MTEQELLVDCVRRLNRTKFDYMLTGSMASNFWGIPRTTHDLDFVIQFPPTAVEDIVDAFSDAFFIQEISVRSAFQSPFQFNAIDLRSALKVDFWMLRDEPFDGVMFSRRRSIRLFDQPTWIATAEDVRLHKLYWHGITPSERQLWDAAGVFAIQQEQLDLQYLRKWSARLGVAPLLGKLLSGEIRPKTT